MAVLAAGLVVTLLIKYANASTNPLWATTDPASGGWNKTGLLFATISLVEYAYRPVSLHPATHIHYRAVEAPKYLRYAVTIGLGSLIHLLQTFLSDAGTVIAWTWTGYPIKGPTLHPFAGVVIAVAAAALAFVRIPPLYVRSVIGLAGTFTLYTFPDWLGFIGGLSLTAYLIALTPIYLRSASALSPASTFGNALLVKCILDVASVITAAYAFVPFGWLLRERTDLIMGFCMLTVVAGDFAGQRLTYPMETRIHMRSRIRITAVDRWTRFLCLGLGLVGLGYSYSKMPGDVPVPFYPDHRIFSGGIWTVSDCVGWLMIGPFRVR